MVVLAVSTASVVVLMDRLVVPASDVLEVSTALEVVLPVVDVCTTLVETVVLPRSDVVGVPASNELDVLSIPVVLVETITEEMVVLNSEVTLVVLKADVGGVPASGLTLVVAPDVRDVVAVVVEASLETGVVEGVVAVTQASASLSQESPAQQPDVLSTHMAPCGRQVPARPDVVVAGIPSVVEVLELAS